MQDCELIEKIKLGEMAAFHKLFQRYKNLVINVCYRLVGNKNEAEDLTQDVFIKIFKSAKHFKHRSSVATWIYRIAINRSLNHLRERKYQRWISLDRDSAVEEFKMIELVAEDCVEADVQKQEQERIVLRAINSLPSEQRVAVMLQRYEGLSCQEIASIQNCSVGAVQARLHRAKKNLYQKLLPFLNDLK